MIQHLGAVAPAGFDSTAVVLALRPTWLIAVLIVLVGACVAHAVVGGVDR